jgi:hypothetical protein
MLRAHVRTSNHTAELLAMAALVAAALVVTTTLSAGTAVKIPMVCSRGPSGQSFHAVVTMPGKQPQGSTYTVRIDGVASGTISHTGLNYIYNMATDYALPAGAYVAGSVRIVPNTGTTNVATGARAWHDAGVIHVLLPGHVDNGTGYTPPSVEFKLQAKAAAGTSLPVSFSQYRVTANALIVGDLLTTCDPTPKPSPIGTTVVIP